MEEENKKQEKENAKKDNGKQAKKIANVNGRDLGISKKDSMAICKMIRGKNVDNAIKMLEEVCNFKRVIKMGSREIGHKHGKRIMAARYPIKASREFIRLLKQLKANAIFFGLEPEDYVILGNANKASRPYKSGGRRFKRTHVTLKLEEKLKKKIGA